MNAAFDYDTTNLTALRDELKLLNENALASGLIAVRDGRPVMPARARRPAAGGRRRAAKVESAPANSTRAKSGGGKVEGKAAEAKAPKKAKTASAAPAKPDTGKDGATRLLAMAGRATGDDSPIVPGTDFTEAGVVRLLAHLRKRRSIGYKFLQRVYRFLTRPVTMGTHTSAGISVERLQLVSRQLHEIELDGWQQFRSVHAARRGKRAPNAPAVDAAPAAAKPRALNASKPKTKAARAELTAKPASKTGTRQKTANREIS